MFNLAEKAAAMSPSAHYRRSSRREIGCDAGLRSRRHAALPGARIVVTKMLPVPCYHVPVAALFSIVAVPILGSNFGSRVATRDTARISRQPS